MQHILTPEATHFFDAARGLAEVVVKNRFAVGDWLEIIHPTGNHNVQLARMENVEALPLSVAPGSGHIVWLPLPASAVGAFVARYVTDKEFEGTPNQVAA